MTGFEGRGAAECESPVIRQERDRRKLMNVPSRIFSDLLGTNIYKFLLSQRLWGGENSA